MKFSLRAADYTFAPGSSQITFGLSGFDVRGLLYVGNATTKADIYIAGDPNLPIATVGGSIVTFSASMTGMAASDILIVLYDDRVTAQPASGVYNSAAPTLSNGQQATLQIDTNGRLQAVVQGVSNGVPAPTLAVATSAANAVLEGRVASAASTNATSLKTSAGNLVGVELYNIATSVRYLKVYNKASAPTVGTDTPTWTIPLPAGGGFSWEPPIPRTFATGLAYAITGGVADSDTTAVAVNDVVGVIRYL